MSKNKNKGGVLAKIEKVGNALPHPAIIFVIMIGILAVIAQICASAGVSVSYYDAKAEAKATIEAIGLLNAEGIRYMFSSLVDNFTSFAPLGVVLVAMLGVGVAEDAGFFDAGLKKMLSNVPPMILTACLLYTSRCV